MLRVFAVRRFAVGGGGGGGEKRVLFVALSNGQEMSTIVPRVMGGGVE